MITAEPHTSGSRTNALRTGADELLDALLAQGVRTVFGYPGGAIMPVYDALHRRGNAVRHVLVRHEQGAIHAAQGFARVSGQPGVCLATSGPGATNCITGLTDALMDSTPIVCIVGQVRSDLLGTDAFQEADVIGLTLAATKWSKQIVRAAEVRPAVDQAFAIARAGRPGPVLLEITRDAQIESIAEQPTRHAEPRVGSDKPAPTEDALQRAAGLLNAAARPYFLIGQGVTLSGAESAALRVAERAGMPVASTLLGLSAFPVSHPQYLGMLGMHGSYAANMITNEADVILAVGMRFDDRVTGRLSGYAPNASLIHVDADPAQIGRLLPPAVGIAADARMTLDALLPLLAPRKHAAWIARARSFEVKERKAIIEPECAPTGGAIRMAEVIRLISTRTGGGATIVSDVGQHQMVAARYYDFDTAGAHITSGGLGTMGFALPAALGAQTAAPASTVVAVIGDGGFQMNLQELATVAEQRAPVKIVVLNNEHLGMVRQWQELFFDARYSSVALPSPDFVTIARGFGVEGERVDDRNSLPAAVARMFDHRGPYLLDVRVEQAENVFPMIPTGAAVNEMRLR